MKKAESVTPNATRRARTMPEPVTAASYIPVLFLLVPQFVAVGLAVLEAQRIRRPQIGIPFLESSLVQQLPDAFGRRDVEVVIAVRTDPQPAFRFFAVDRGLAAGTTLP